MLLDDATPGPAGHRRPRWGSDSALRRRPGARRPGRAGAGRPRRHAARHGRRRRAGAPRARGHADPTRCARSPTTAGRARCVVAGMGGSGISGDVLAAVCGTGLPGPGLDAARLHPARLGRPARPRDRGVLLGHAPRRRSASPPRPPSAAPASSAWARPARPCTTSSPSTPGRGRSSPSTPATLMPRASLWLLATPLLLVAHALGLADVPRARSSAPPTSSTRPSVECGPVVAAGRQPGKLLGVSLAASLPMVWGTSPLGAVAAYRLACQLNENAKLPGRGRHAARRPTTTRWSRSTARSRPRTSDDIFRDPLEDGAAPARLRLVLLRDSDEHPQDARRADVDARPRRASATSRSTCVARGRRPPRRAPRLAHRRRRLGERLRRDRAGHRPVADRTHQRAEGDAIS